MAELAWDQTSEREYETGVDHGVLYPAANGLYPNGYAWNGLVTVTESPSGAETNYQYADNIKYLNLKSVEEFGGTIEAFTYPDEFGQCDGTSEPHPGVLVGQQGRKSFGLAYRTLKGNDVDGTDFGYKLHLVWGADAMPSEKAFSTVNDSPEAITFSWEFTTTGTEIPGTNPATGKPYKRTSALTLDSTEADPASLAALETILYGSAGVDPRLPLPGEVIALFSGAVTEVTPAAPTYNPTTDEVTIPATVGVVYSVDGVEVPSGAFGPITDDVMVTAVPAPGYVFAPGSDDDWAITFA